MSNRGVAVDSSACRTTPITSNGGIVPSSLIAAASSSDSNVVATATTTNESTIVDNSNNASVPIAAVSESISNGHTNETSKFVPIKEEEYNDEEDVAVVDDEENLLMTLEEKAQHELDETVMQQPKAIEEAPRLLQAALKDGKVKADESEEEEEKDNAVTATTAAASMAPQIHARVRSLFVISVSRSDSPVVVSGDCCTDEAQHFSFVSYLFFALAIIESNSSGRSIGIFVIEGVGIF
jgi:hypothetical protein